MIELYDYWRSSASYRVRIALELAGVEWKSVPVNLLEAAQISDEHLRRNPQGLVPALAIDGEMLTQSLAIIEYLHETHSMNLLPKDPVLRARTRALSYAIAMEIHPVCNLRVAKYVQTASQGVITLHDWMQHFISNGLRAVEAMLADDSFSIDNTIRMSDICLVPQIYNARRYEIDLSEFPKTSRIDAKLNEHPAFERAHPDNVQKA